MSDLFSTEQSPVFFWNENEENGWFSNWHECRFTVNGQEYCHVEQYMMAEKAKFFGDEEKYQLILQTQSPKKCKALGRDVRPFDSDAWDVVRYEIVKTGCQAKFDQNPELRAFLLSTGHALLAEASPSDEIWGIGLDARAAAHTAPSEWPGRNLMGRILMEIREEYRKNVFLDRAVDCRISPVRHYNCAQATVVPFVEAAGIDEETAMRFAAGFGGGMKRASVCGAVTGGLMALGLFSIDDPATLGEYHKKIKARHNGCLECADLLRMNAEKGLPKKPHCDAMVYEIVELVEAMLKEKGRIA